MKTNFLLALFSASAIVAAGACGGRGSPVSPTPLASPPATATGAVNAVITVASREVDPRNGVLELEEPEASAPAPQILAISPASGPTSGGTDVLISGTDFAEGATVSFGDAPAINVIVSSTELITATTPAHAEGAVDVIVSNPDGQSGALAGGYAYLGEVLPPPPSTAPTIGSVVPPSGPAAGSTEVTISGTGFAEGATVSFGDAPAIDVIVSSAELIAATTPAHAEGAADVIVSNPDGQSGALASGYTFAAGNLPAPTTITITSSGVSPKEVEIAAGSRVLFVNEDRRPHDINSDPHPLHTDCREINAVGFLQPGRSRQTDEFRSTRTCGFHDHNRDSDESLRGRIVIR